MDHRLLACAWLAALALGCASSAHFPSQSPYRFFSEPDGADPWYVKVEKWQERQRQDEPEAKLASQAEIDEVGRRSGLLRIKMGRWEREKRLALVKQVAEWSQAESRRHYRFDPLTDYANDPWPTTKDLLDTNGDDCDGLDLISYKLLREFGFPPEQLYRAILKRDRDGANHMVTFWFDNSEDPWVIDSIGAVTMRVRRFSDLPGWTPTKIFNERNQYTPVRLRAGGNELARADEDELARADDRRPPHR